jgi:hypothetical protein
LSDPVKLTDEEVAALIDGTLSPSEREDVLRRVAVSPRWSEVLRDAAALSAADDEAGEGERNGTVRRWRVRERTAMAIAAVLVISVVGGIVWQRRASGEEGSAVRLAASFVPPADARVVLALGDRPWSEVRSDGPVVSDRGRAVRVGALLVDLRVAMGAPDNAPAAARGAALVQLLDGLPGASPLVRALRLRGEDEWRAPLDPELERSVLVAVGRAQAEAGATLEAMRLAASAGATLAPFAPALRQAATALAGDSSAVAALREAEQLAGGAASDGTRAVERLRVLLDALAR